MNVQTKKLMKYCHIIALHEILRRGMPKEVYVDDRKPKC